MEPTPNEQERMKKVLTYDLGIMTEEEQIEYLKELIKRYPDLATKFVNGEI